MKSTLNKDEKTKMKFIDEMDFAEIKELLNKKDWSDARCTLAIIQYKSLLKYHLLYPEKSLVPSIDANEVWRLHNLNKERYALDCSTLFGYCLLCEGIKSFSPSCTK